MDCSVRRTQKRLSSEACQQAAGNPHRGTPDCDGGKGRQNFIPIISEEPEGVTAQVIAPIICEGDAIGAVALLSRESRIKFGEPELKLVSTAAGFLGRQMEG